MEKQILDLLTEMSNEMKDMKSNISEMKDMKSNIKKLKSEMHNWFDSVEVN